MSMRLAAVTLALILLYAEAQAARVVGYVRDSATQRYLYTEVHEQSLAPDGAVQTGLTTYFDAQGREIARKTLDYRANRTVPIYRMDMPALRYAEGISSNAPEATVFKREGDKETREQLPLDDGPVAADAGFNQLLLDHLPALREGQTVRFGLIVAGHTSRYRFRARKTSEHLVQGRAVLDVRVEPDSMLRLVLSPIDLRYDLKSKRLLSYEGLSNLIDPDTDQVYKRIHITYGGDAPKDARLPELALDQR